MHSPTYPASLSAAFSSMSDFHPGSWQPSWSVANILVGLHSFMNSEEITTGGMSATKQARETWAAQSHGWNVAQPRFVKIFPEYSGDKKQATPLPNMGETRKPASAEKRSAADEQQQKGEDQSSSSSGISNGIASASGNRDQKRHKRGDDNAGGRGGDGGGGGGTGRDAARAGSSIASAISID